MAIRPKRRLFTVDEYERMAETGVLRPDDRVELIEGEVVERPTIRPLHAATVTRLAHVFMTRLGPRVIVRSQNPVRLGDLSQPQPDVAVVPRRDDFYADAHPVPGDVLLLVEVADATLAFDRDVKIPLYARSGVPECWLVDVEAGTLTVHRRPGPDGYEDVATAAGTVSPSAFPDETFTLDELIGR